MPRVLGGWAFSYGRDTPVLHRAERRVQGGRILMRGDRSHRGMHELIYKVTRVALQGCFYQGPPTPRPLSSEHGTCKTAKTIALTKVPSSSFVITFEPAGEGYTSL